MGERERKFENGPINAQIHQSGKKEKICEKNQIDFGSKIRLTLTRIFYWGISNIEPKTCETYTKKENTYKYTLFLFPATQPVRFEQFLFARGSDRRARVFFSEFRLPSFVLSGSFDKSMMFEQLKSELISSKESKSLLEEWYGVEKSDFADLWTGGEGVFGYKIWEEETVEATAGIQIQQNTVICFFLVSFD